ncbi:reverse transcriptase domain-containing protein [Tanacetum coccineum]|uniref:Reverse transcriptase domain-containing protein n=1 Tax=Tanacetum coccineum TaxID=301880 RepID=A0ABQ4X0S6_9ASTR
MRSKSVKEPYWKILRRFSDFCRSKCHKNFKMERNPRKEKLTKAYRRLHDKDMTPDANNFNPGGWRTHLKNRLSGRIPNSVARFLANSFIGNDLCGPPLSLCEVRSDVLSKTRSLNQTVVQDGPSTTSSTLVKFSFRSPDHIMAGNALMPMEIREAAAVIKKCSSVPRVEEKMTLKEVDAQAIEEIETKIIAKDGTITRVPGKFQGYETSKEDPDNMNGWLLEDEDEVERNEVDSDLESTASSKPEYDGKGSAIALTRWIEKMENVIDNSGCAENQKVRYATSSLGNKDLTWWNTQCQARGRVAAMAISWNDFKELMVEEFCPSNEMEKFHELAKLVPHLVTPESSRIKRYIARLAPEIRGMLRATKPTTIQNAILRAGILTDKAVSCGTLTKGGDKRKGVEEPSKTGGS